MFSILRRNSRWPPKTLLYGFPVKCVLHFTQKFKMATKKWRESDFCKMSPVLCKYPADPKFCRNRSISHCFQDKCAFVLYAEIQDGWPKVAGNDFCEKSPVDSEDTPWVQNVVKIAPCGSKILTKSLYLTRLKR